MHLEPSQRSSLRTPWLDRDDKDTWLRTANETADDAGRSAQQQHNMFLLLGAIVTLNNGSMTH